MEYMTSPTHIAEAFLAACDRKPAKAAIVDGDVEGESSPQSMFTYGILRALAGSFARLVAQTTTSPHVGIMLPTCKEFPAAFFGISLAGRTPTPLNFLLQKEEVAFTLKDGGIDTVVTSEYFRPALAHLSLRLIVLEELARKPPQHAALAGCLAAGKIKPESDTAVLLYTSGTTGYPKGVMLTHENLLSNVQDSKTHVGFHEDQVFLGILPLFHSFALTCSMLVPLLNGATTVFMKRFQANRVVDCIRSKNVNVLLGIPSQFRAMAKAQTGVHGAISERAEAQKLPCSASSLEICVAGGEALPENVRVAFEDAFGVPLHEGYGMTETSPVISVNTRSSAKPGTVGKPLPSVEVRIMDDAGRTRERESDGEVQVRGPNVMKGYLNQPEMTRETVCADGWLRTGDVGRLDSDGFLTITGRKKEMILSSGENIFPAEIERCLADHPAVAECAVISVPDDVRGEVPKAFIVLREACTATESDLRDFARERIAAYKVPRYVEFRKELAHGPTGKILKKTLR
jgi:long-chain acyl-CoA synthetase